MALGAFKRFEADDYGMGVTLAFYTTFVVAINIVANTNSNLLPPGFDVNSLTSQEIQDRSYGSKLILVVEQCQCVTIWGTKCCLLALYLRLTTLRKENIAIKILLAYVALSFVIMEILYFAVWCRPFWEYWAVPTKYVSGATLNLHEVPRLTTLLCIVVYNVMQQQTISSQTPSSISHPTAPCWPSDCQCS